MIFEHARFHIEWEVNNRAEWLEMILFGIDACEETYFPIDLDGSIEL